MRTVVCTAMWGNAWERYGREFAISFARYWPEDVRLIVFTDRHDLTLPRGELHQLATIPGFAAFGERFGDDQEARGRAQAAHVRWKDKETALGYSWRHDAIRWCPQGIVPAAAARLAPDAEILCWLDADVVSLAPIPADWIDKLIGDADGAYLGRPPKHSEIGFWASRLPQTLPMIEEFARLFLSGSFLEEREWHSAYLWDVARTRAESGALGAPRVLLRNLTPLGRGHVWLNSPLRQYTLHYKGERKASIVKTPGGRA